MSVASYFGNTLDFLLGLTVTGQTVDVIPGASDPSTFDLVAASETSNAQLVIENIPVPAETDVIEIDLYDASIAGVELALEDGQLTLTISRVDGDYWC
jgi:hypothetical protein